MLKASSRHDGRNTRNIRGYPVETGRWRGRWGLIAFGQLADLTDGLIALWGRKLSNEAQIKNFNNSRIWIEGGMACNQSKTRRPGFRISIFFNPRVLPQLPAFNPRYKRWRWQVDGRDPWDL